MRMPTCNCIFACCGALRGLSEKLICNNGMMMADVGKPERRVIVVPEEKPVSVPIPDQPKPVKAPEKEPA